MRAERVMTDTERKQIRAIVELIKPGHTHFVELFEPGAQPSDDTWFIGVSLFGLDSRLS